MPPRAHSSLGHSSFQVAAADSWNQLQKSLQLQTIISVNSFKHILSKFLYTCSCPSQSWSCHFSAPSSLLVIAACFHFIWLFSFHCFYITICQSTVTLNQINYLSVYVMSDLWSLLSLLSYVLLLYIHMEVFSLLPGHCHNKNPFLTICLVK